MPEKVQQYHLLIVNSKDIDQYYVATILCTYAEIMQLYNSITGLVELFNVNDFTVNLLKSESNSMVLLHAYGEQSTFETFVKAWSKRLYGHDNPPLTSYIN